jgi:biopolymer transport protein ExbD
MAIRFRCRHCQTLMSISSRRAGAIVPCATCGEDVLVPEQDEWTSPAPIREPEPPPEPKPPADGDEPPAETDDEQAMFAGFTVEEQGFVEPPPPPRDVELDERDQPVLADQAEDDDEPDDEDEFRLGGRERVDDEMDLTPMVDVVFQLLIFFMVTASFSLQKSLEMPVPDPDKQGAAQSLQPLEDMQDTSVIVEIDDRDNVLVDDEPLGDIGRLPDALRDRMRREQKSELVLTASANATHRTVVAVIDAANEVGMQRIRMAAPGRSGND